MIHRLLLVTPTRCAAAAQVAARPDSAGKTIVVVLPDSGEISIEIVAGRDASVNFDMQWLASLLHGDRITVRRAPYQARFLHPPGWSYYATLRRKLHWNSGGQLG